MSVGKFKAHLAAVAALAMAAMAPAQDGELPDLEMRNAADMNRVGPRICARLKAFYTRRPRPWRSWRGAQKTGRRRYA